jgi:hypothetical protein
MKVLYILKREVDDTVKRLIEEHKKANEVKVISLTEDISYDALVDDIFSHDRVISW